MASIKDDFMKEMISKTKNYSKVILNAAPNIGMKDAEKIIWERARRNFNQMVYCQSSVL
jgi:predicted nucleic acid-binding OB-fold protein